MYHYIIIILAMLLCKYCYSIETIVENIRLAEKVDSHRIVLDVNKEIPFSSFTLSNPYRLVVDLEAQKFKKFKKNNTSLIKNIRLGSPERGVFRLVFDLRKESYIKKSFTLLKTKDKPFRIVIDLEVNKKLTKEKIKIKKSKPIITIDPGHGGIDPGAVKNNTKEKFLTLKASKELKILLEKKNYKVYLTRNSDKYVSLSERRYIAKKYNSDLFVSIHIDSVENPATRGISVYTLSEIASDRIAASLAEQANKVDKIAGIRLTDVDHEVATILLDLTRRDTKNSSALVAERLVSDARIKGHRLLRRPHRQAGFAVLKSPSIPSVLVELGFLSNSKDVIFLKNKKDRLRIINTIADTIDDYFKSKDKL